MHYKFIISILHIKIIRHDFIVDASAFDKAIA